MRPGQKIKVLLAPVDRALRWILRPFQIVSNFIFLSVSYFLGIGLSALFYRLGPGRKKPDGGEETYWQEIPPAPKEREPWLRPF